MFSYHYKSVVAPADGQGTPERWYSVSERISRGMQLNRRQWLAAGLAPALPLSATPRVDRSWISVITDEIAKSPEDAIAFARQYRLSYVELRGVPGARKHYQSLSKAELQLAARQFADAGIKVSFLNSSLFKHRLPGTTTVNPKHTRPNDEERFAGRYEQLERALESANELGVDKMRVFGFLRVADPMALMPRIAEHIGEMAELAQKQGVQLLVENEGSCNVATCAEVSTLLKLLPSPAVGINWDPMNGRRFNEEPMPDGYNLLPKKRLGNVQIKGKSLLPGYARLLDWKGIFETLAADGYRGKFGLETHIFGEGQIQASHDSMKEILRLLES